MKMRKPKRRLFSLTLRQQNTLAGYLFSLPFILGFLFVFLYPTILSAVFSFNELVITKTGYELKYVGLENYRHVFRVHPTFIRDLTETTINMLSQAFWILVFSFFAAIILNQNFRGRLIARAVLFLPIVMASGIILKIEARDYMTGILEYGMESVSAFLVTPALSVYLSKFQLPDALITNILAAIESLPNIIRSSESRSWSCWQVYRPFPDHCMKRRKWKGHWLGKFLVNHTAHGQPVDPDQHRLHNRRLFHPHPI